MNTIELLKSYGATVKTDEASRVAAYFYHIDLNDAQILGISYRNDIDMIVFYCSSISDRDLGKFRAMTTLRKLGLNSCKNITDESVEILAELSGLRFVSLIDTAMTTQGKKRLKKLAPDLESN